MPKGFALAVSPPRSLGSFAENTSRFITPHLDTGDHVVVINASKVVLSGNKADQKTYFRHSGYMGDEKHIPFRRMIETASGAGHRAGREGHAAQEHPGAAHEGEAQSLCWGRASSSGTEPSAPKDRRVGRILHGC